LPSLEFSADSATRPAVAATLGISDAAVNWTHSSIEAVRVGDRVLTDASASAMAQTAIDSVVTVHTLTEGDRHIFPGIA
jgi:anti-sigma factor ChrR (cupin superfamily)